jgi:hypothetical protein
VGRLKLLSHAFFSRLSPFSIQGANMLRRILLTSVLLGFAIVLIGCSSAQVVPPQGSVPADPVKMQGGKGGSNKSES